MSRSSAATNAQWSRPPAARRGQRILIVEDDDYTQHLLASALRFAGFEIDACADGGAALDHVDRFKPDLVVLDVMLPVIDGLEVCRRLRSAAIQTPVIFLSARDRTDDKVRGLVEGGDDYVTKPFDLDELVARIDAVLKRAFVAPDSSRRYEFGTITLDDDEHRVWVGGELVHLAPTEYRLLRYLLANAGRVVTRDQILSHVWGWDYEGDRGVVETYVFYVRKRIGRAAALIHTVRGVGYVLREE